MKRFLAVIAIGTVLALCTACPKEKGARDTAAALKGSIEAAQAKHPECASGAKSTVCDAIARGVAGQNALITATETYCGWSPSAPPADQNAKCVPVKSAEDALTVALANARELTAEIKGVI